MITSLKAKQSLKIAGFTIFTIVLIIGFIIINRVEYLEKRADILFFFGGKTIFDVEVLWYALTVSFLGICCYIILRKRKYGIVFLSGIMVLLIIGCYYMSMKGYLGDYYSYYSFPSPAKSTELVLVDKSFLHDSNYGLYVRKNKYFLKELDNASLYELTSEFHWDERRYTIVWIDETTVEIECIQPDEHTVNESVRFTVT